MRYSAPLDGIRALAIAGVLVFHVAPRRLTGGFAGVDVFFVLSGFLITSVILHDLRDGTFSLREFYLRRIQRLLPNLVLTVAAAMALWGVFGLPSETAKAARHGLWALFNLSNVYVWKYLGGYWGHDAEWAPLTHTWSLGIEEQFYLLFPALLALLVRRWPQRATLVLAVCTAASAILCIMTSVRAPEASFYLLPTRVWELLLGAVLASAVLPWTLDLPGAPTRPAPAARTVVGWGGVLVVLVSLARIDETMAFPGWVALVPTLGTAAVLWSIAGGESSVARVLSSAPLVAIGRRSYSIYLWHWPCITLGRTLAVFSGRTERTGAVLGATIGVLAACAAYEWVEQPLRRRGKGRGRRLTILGSGFAVTTCAALLLGARHPVADPEQRFEQPQFFGEAYNSGKSAASEIAQSSSLTDVAQAPRTEVGDDAWRDGGIIHRYGGEVPRVVVLGSSHALMYSHLLDELARERGVTIAFLGMPATPPFFTAAVDRNFKTVAEAREFDDVRKTWLGRWHPDVVFAIDRWDSRPTWRSFASELGAFVRAVEPLTGRIVVVTQPPALPWPDNFNLREFVLSRRAASGALPSFRPDAKEATRRAVAIDADRAAARDTVLRVLHTEDRFSAPDGTVRYSAGRDFYYLDDDHLTEAGAQLLRPRFAAALDEGLQRATRRPR